MQLTVTTEDDRIVTVEVDGNDSAATLKAILEVETAIPSSEQLLLFNGQPLAESGPLASAGVQNGDLLMLMRQRQAAAAAAAPQFNADGSVQNPEVFMRQMAADAGSMANLAANNPQLANAIRSGNVEVFQEFLRAAHRAKQEQEAARRREIDLMNADPFDPETQRRIQEAIEAENVKENFDQAWEHSPEVFSDVVMLYVNLEVNGTPLKAFVDSGAQRTIMSAQCATRCGLMRLLDKRFAGVARGVGTGKILGRVHAAPIKVAGEFLSASITVLESNDMEFLFGLDMLRRHQCSIDLKANVLRFGSCDVSLPFLPEHELPMHLRSEAAMAADAQGTASASGVGAAASGQSPQAAAGAAAAARSAANAPIALTPQSAPSAAAPAQQQPQARQQPAQQAQPAAQQAQQAQGAGMPAGIDQAEVQRLMGLGFTAQQCTEALQVCNGNEEHAASLLFEMHMS